MKQNSTPDAATLELWRVAETDDLDALWRVLPRVVDIDARNKHGVTALMRAACHGNERMVHALLDHGADPNLARNDKFTPLTLAAFFGHAEAVKTLIEGGARTEIVTRCGTSAHMWASARTFVEVARSLETQPRAQPPARITAPPRTAPAPPPPPVKTLKDPPEIWDLVHEVPRDFDPRSAFLSRLKSINSSFALRVAAVLLVSAVAVAGAMLYKKSQKSQAQELDPDAIPPISQSSITESTAIQSSSVETVTSEPVVETSEAAVVRNHGARKNVLPRQVRPRATAAEDVTPDDRSKEAPAPPVIARPQFETRSSNKANAGLSPQVIAPAKSAPPKAKVIQWP